jgi:feruloyl esterase
LRGRARLREVAAAAAALLLPGAAPADRCRALERLAGPTLAVSATHEGGICRVTAVARPRPRAAIRVELHLPPPERWSGRYYQMGNGGFAGRIDRATLAAAAARGDVAGATDTGHVGDGFDARWAAGRPDLVRDYAWASIKVASDTARQVTRAYYGRDARRRYAMGCSFGGRQALVAAARWPDDWDGVVAGAPATRWLERLAAFGRIQRAIRAPGAWLTREQLAALVRSGDRAALTPAQARGVAAVEAAGYPLAGAEAAEWARWIYAADPGQPSQRTFADQARRYLAGARAADFAVPGLARFAAKGGRVLSYFGMADAVLPPALAVADARRLGARAGFYRLFLVPGMAHCQGGAAAHAIGQSLAAPAGADDADHDVRRALERWVEAGEPPQRLVATTPTPPHASAVLRPAF